MTDGSAESERSENENGNESGNESGNEVVSENGSENRREDTNIKEEGDDEEGRDCTMISMKDESQEEELPHI